MAVIDSINSGFTPLYLFVNGSLNAFAGYTSYSNANHQYVGLEVTGHLVFVPKPETIALLGIGLTDIAISRRHKL